MRAPRTFFDCVHTSLMADLGMAKEPWQREHAMRAHALFTADQTLANIAAMLAAVHRATIDYIEQAPVIVLAAHGANHYQLDRRKVRAAIVKAFLAKAGRAHRLNELMKALDLAPGLRRLQAAALTRRDHVTLGLLNAISGPHLAQIIPTEVADQRAWLTWIAQLQARTEGSGTQMRRHAFLHWAIANCRGAAAWLVAGDIYDWVRSPNSGFSPRMSFQQAQAASQRWHEEFARRNSLGHLWGQRLLDRRVVSYAPLPEKWTKESWQFVALNTLLALEEESLRMHHCVRTYWPRIVSGVSRIYSIRHEGRRLATLEVRCVKSAREKRLSFEMVQLKGPCNAKPTPETDAIAAEFLDVMQRKYDKVQSALARSHGAGSPRPSTPEAGAPG